MAAQKGQMKVKSDSGVKAGTSGRKPKKAGLRDLDAKGAKAVQGGFCATGKHLDP